MSETHAGPPTPQRSVSSPDTFFTSAAASFNPRPYQPPIQGPRPRPPPAARNNSLMHPHIPMDPLPTDPGAIFIHPPFDNFPGHENYPEGITYSVMAANPEWFLDPTDYTSENQTHNNPHAIGYPTQLEPPRGWNPSRKKDLKDRGADGWPQGEEPRLRCTFCRRTYAGINAKSMWRRHVHEKHKVDMANRRHTTGGGRTAPTKQANDKENVSVSSKAGRANKASASQSAAPRASSSKSRQRSTTATSAPPPAYSAALYDRGNGHESHDDYEYEYDGEEDDLNPPGAPRIPQEEFPAPAYEHDLSRPSVPRSGFSASPPPDSPQSDTLDEYVPPYTPPEEPERPSSPELALNDPDYGLITPNYQPSPFRAVKAWRFPDPSHPLHQDVGELPLAAVTGYAPSPSSAVKTSPSSLDASPLIISSTTRRPASLFNTPSVGVITRRAENTLERLFDEPSPAPMSTPRKLFDSPGPVIDRLLGKRGRSDDSPSSRSLFNLTPGRWASGTSGNLFGPALPAGDDPFATYKTPRKTDSPFFRDRFRSGEGSSSSPMIVTPPNDSPIVRLRKASGLKSKGTDKSKSTVGLLDAFMQTRSGVRVLDEEAGNEDESGSEDSDGWDPLAKGRLSSSKELMNSRLSNERSTPGRPPMKRRRKSED